VPTPTNRNPQDAGHGFIQIRRARRALALAGAAALGAGALTACSSAASTTSSASGGTTSISVGVGGNIFDLPERIAESQGFFTKQGLKVTFVTLTSATGTAALQSGSVQFLNDSPNDYLTALSKSIPETAIAVEASGNPLGLIVNKDFASQHSLTSKTSAAKVASALAGSTAGYSSPNTKAEAGIYLKAYGIDASKINWVSLPSPTADKAALVSHQIDWFLTSEPTPLEIQDSGDGVVVADDLSVPAWGAAKAGYGIFEVAQPSYLKGNPTVAKEFATAIQQATQYIHDHLTGTAVLSAAQQILPGVPTSVIQASLAQVAWPTDSSMSAADWTTTVSFVRSLGTVSGSTSVSPADWTNEYLP
jgi:NitT/TauT family transport system substrate-binding protein